MDEKYQRIKVIGKGSFGKAYLVKNTEANALCVVKQMETSMMNPTERSEAVKEAMLLKSMNHPNIVRFQEVFMTRKGRLCIVMDYADGGDVHMEIKASAAEGKLLLESRILEWFAQTCFALKYVHDRKVLHRDLKTQNIFLMTTGQIMLGDFGIAKVLNATKDYAKTMVGTPYYLSPEIIKDQPYNFKSDVWSVGVVLYEMVTLKHPFDAESLVNLAAKILKDQYPPPDESFSTELKVLIKTMLNKDAAMRPSVGEILVLPFLQRAMHDTNQLYGLGVDLSVFVPQDPAEVAAASGLVEVSARSEAQEPAAAVAAAATRVVPAADDDSVLIGTVPAQPKDERPATPPEEKKEDEQEYSEEEFEDYSGSEDGEKPEPPSDLKMSVRNLKLDRGVASAQTLEAVPENAGEPVSAGLPSMAGSGTEGNARIGMKADSLRSYLQEQMNSDEFKSAYALVRTAGETSTEELQSQMATLIGADKSSELFLLFQLLCFLEDVARGDAVQSEADAA